MYALTQMRFSGLQISKIEVILVMYATHAQAPVNVDLIK